MEKEKNKDKNGEEITRKIIEVWKRKRIKTSLVIVIFMLRALTYVVSSSF